MSGTFRDWIDELRESVVEGDYGYEPGEFSVYPDHWRPLWVEGRWFATEAGADAAGDVELPPPPGADLVRWWAGRLPGTLKIAEALIEAWPRDMARDELALAVNMIASGGSFGTYLSRLASPGLIERDGGFVRLSAEAMGPLP